MIEESRRVAASLNKALYDSYLCLIALNKQQIYYRIVYGDNGGRFPMRERCGKTRTS